MNLHFCYIFRNTSGTFEIENSIRIVKILYPNSEITVIGDKVNNINHIPFNHKANTNRASRVALMLLELAKRFDDFILMYDDIFFSKSVDLKLNYTCGNLVQKNNKGYNLCIVNSIEFLQYHKKNIKNFDCHQPMLFNSKKLKEMYEFIDINQSHLPKSIYGNFYNLKSKEIDNLKVQTFNQFKERLNDFGMVSSSDSMCERTKSLILTLPTDCN